MNVQGERQFDAARATVWAVLNDPALMAKSMPGVESFDVKDDRHWTANVKIPLGLGALRMAVSMEKTEERESEFAKMAIKGNGVGAIMNMDTSFHLADADAGTKMKWEADVHILGPVGSMGQRVLQPIVNQQVDSVLNALDKQGQEAAAAQPPAPGTGPNVEHAGEPAEGAADPEGSSGAQEGLSPWAPDSYSEGAEGPTTSTDD
jgi:carbon monoxide dehydrogenase subunit G